MSSCSRRFASAAAAAAFAAIAPCPIEGVLRFSHGPHGASFLQAIDADFLGDKDVGNLESMPALESALANGGGSSSSSQTSKTAGADRGGSTTSSASASASSSEKADSSNTLSTASTAGSSSSSSSSTSGGSQEARVQEQSQQQQQQKAGMKLLNNFSAESEVAAAKRLASMFTSQAKAALKTAVPPSVMTWMESMVEYAQAVNSSSNASMQQHIVHTGAPTDGTAVQGSLKMFSSTLELNETELAALRAAKPLNFSIESSSPKTLAKTKTLSAEEADKLSAEEFAQEAQQAFQSLAFRNNITASQVLEQIQFLHESQVAKMEDLQREEEISRQMELEDAMTATREQNRW
eukprot:CAMPEP_0206562144 /NCGR_PEP_ID=MMETSP0325_2-20121206/22051_1 /ASSEMBLY_ACC=CAM_ASM_000347 /TAXON_ID=2866 /ORGANISM="Crypthecodinium cohnii, Strain Seligo" /LENGTH=349 /DNA_ID=CAMNT_0054064253 /DNA_START=97 /DNA_END=1143 /DNA_ORIENTATION=+